jgi:ubiquinone/menaquinone biosynthesis C-methylase UbiE
VPFKKLENKGAHGYEKLSSLTWRDAVVVEIAGGVVLGQDILDCGGGAGDEARLVCIWTKVEGEGEVLKAARGI